MVTGILFLLIFGFGGWYLFTAIFDVIFGTQKENNYTSKPDNITNINHITENHLHVSKEDLENLLNKNN